MAFRKNDKNSLYFNPRSHEGSDKMSRQEGRCGGQISIHAPTRGATRQALTQTPGHQVSIHAPTRGAPLFRYYNNYIGFISIHAPTRGATVRFWETEFSLHISIHAPTRGATVFQNNWYSVSIFQSTLPRGERLNLLLLHNCLFLYFNPRSHEGSDLYSSISPGVASYFNPRSHEGSDTVGPCHALLYDPFQSTLPRGERLA